MTKDNADIFAWLIQHPKVAIILCGIAIYISLCLIIRMWIVHPKEKILKKVWWTFVLCIPIFGWLAYGAGFKVPGTDSQQNQGSSISGIDSGAGHL